jgi:hypothetical protein
MNRLLLILVLAFLLPVVASGEEASFVSPKATMKSLLTILRDGRLNHVADCFVEPQTEAEENILLYGLGDDMYTPAVHRALVAKFGEKESPLGKVLASFDQQLAVVDSMEETTDGINGRLSVKGLDRAGLAFVKVGDDWKIALTPGLMLRSVPPQRLATAKAVRTAYLSTIKEIEQGKFATAEEATQALDAHRRAAQQGGGPQPRK